MTKKQEQHKNKQVKKYAKINAKKTLCQINLLILDTDADFWETLASSSSRLINLRL